MKKTVCFLLVLTLILGICGCKPKEDPILRPVNFYYRTAQLTYGAPDGLIRAWVVESSGYEEDLLGLLNKYLKGPQDNSYHVTFPASTKLLSISFSEQTAYLQLNESFSWLSGLDLTIASACLAKTAMELTGATAICISAENSTLDGAGMIIMDEKSILLVDTTGKE